MRVIRQWELSGSRSYPAMGAIRQWELSGNRNYPATGVIRQRELFASESYPAILNKRLQRLIKRNLLNGLGFGQ